MSYYKILANTLDMKIKRHGKGVIPFHFSHVEEIKKALENIGSDNLEKEVSDISRNLETYFSNEISALSGDDKAETESARDGRTIIWNEKQPNPPVVFHPIPADFKPEK